MKFNIYGNLDKKYIEKTLIKVSRLIKIHEDLEINFIKNEIYCYYATKNFSLKAKEETKKACKLDKVSFSYTYKDKDLIVIFLTKKNEFLLKNKKALIGLILHEIMHSLLRKKGLDASIREAYEKTFKKNLKLLKRLEYNKKDLESLFLNIGENSILLLKELYTNTELIKKGYGDYILEKYYQEFLSKRICPKPVFFENFKEEAQKDMRIIEIAFDFEFALLSIILPLQKIDEKKARILIKYLEDCYELNIKELSRKCRDLVYPFMKKFSYKQEFQIYYLNTIFNKVYELLS